MKRLPAFLLPLTAVAAPVPVELFRCADPNLEVTVWAASPLLRNPTNIDIDAKGRIWVAEGVNYRQHFNRQPNGDRIMVLEDTDGDGKADTSWPFVQEPFLRAPLGVAVIGNKVVVSMAPDLVVYTDKDGDAVFDAAKGDTREVLLTGFNGRNHDHSLHSVTVGPDGKWYFSAGNCGAKFTDKSGKTFRIAAKQNVSWWPKDPERPDWDPNEIAGQKSDDGRVYVGGFIARMDPDGSNVEILAHNLRNSYENCVSSYGDIFASDNDDQPACRVFAVLDGGNYGFASADGQRTWQADRRPGQSIATATWRQEDPGVAPAGDIYGGGAPTGCVFYENGALGDKHEGTLLVCESARNTIFGYKPQPDGAGWKLERFDFLTTNKAGDFAGTDFKGGNKGIKADDTKTLFRPSDIAVGPDGALYISDWHDPRTGGHADMDDALHGTIYRVAPKGFKSVVLEIDLTNAEGAIAALKSPAVHVRAVGARALREQQLKDQNVISSFTSTVSAVERARLRYVRQDSGIHPLTLWQSLFHEPDPVERIMGIRLVGQRGSYRVRVAPINSLRKEQNSRVRVAMCLQFARSGNPSASVLKGESPLIDESMGGLMEQRQLLIHEAALTETNDRNALEAYGLACGNQPALVYDQINPVIGDPDPLKWSDKFAALAWRLHPPQSILAFKTRALSPALPLRARLEALTAIGFNDTKEAAAAMLEVAVKLSPGASEGKRAKGHSENSESLPSRAEGHSGNSEPLPAREEGHSGNSEPLPAREEGHSGNSEPLPAREEGHSGNSEPLPARAEGHSENSERPSASKDGSFHKNQTAPDAARVRETALGWLLNRKDSTWKAHGLNAALKERGLYDPEKITLLPAPLPAPVAVTYSTADAAKLPGDAKRGEAVAARCFLCHQIGGTGADYGPDLTTFGRTQTTEALLRSIIEPDADIAHGFAGTRVETSDGTIIEGLVLSESDPLLIRSAGGLTQMVPAARVKTKTALQGRSLMMSAAQLGLTAQEAADVAAYLRGR